MEAYSINDVEKLTGIKAHTLRIWEKRYNGLLPHRTATQIRYYDDDQLRRLLNVTTLLDLGHKISKIMEYNEEYVHELILDAGQQPATEPVYTVYINQLTQAMIAFDEAAMEKTVNAVFIRFGIQIAVIKVLYPFLRRTGVLWSTANIAPAQEHFASNFIRRKFAAIVDGLLPVPSHGKIAILFLPPDEWHEIGLLFAEYLMRQSGIHTVCLGQNVPYKSVEATIEKIKPKYLVTFMVAGQNEFTPLTPLVGLANANPDVKILYSAIAKSTSTTLPPNIIYLNNPISIFDHL